MKACIFCQLLSYGLAFSPIPLPDVIERKREQGRLSLIVVIAVEIFSFEDHMLKWQDF
jgi:hypothetical protein